MDIHEYQAKALLARHSRPEDPAELAGTITGTSSGTSSR